MSREELHQAVEVQEVLVMLLSDHRVLLQGQPATPEELRLTREEVALVNGAFEQLREHLRPTTPPEPLADAVQELANVMRAQVLLEQARHLEDGPERDIMAKLAATLLGVQA